MDCGIAHTKLTDGVNLCFSEVVICYKKWFIHSYQNLLSTVDGSNGVSRFTTFYAVLIVKANKMGILTKFDGKLPQILNRAAV